MTNTRPIHLVGEPKPGRYLLKLVPKAWAVPASITRTGETFIATVDGIALDGEWTKADIEAQLLDWVSGEPPHPFLRITLYGRPCTEAVYQHRLAMKRWAAEHAPWHPCLSPLKPINPSKLPAEDF